MTLNASILAKLDATEEEIVAQLDKDVREIFATMVGVEISQGATEVDGVTSFKDSVTAMVGFAGVFNGMASFHTSKKLAIYFASQMLGMEVETIDDDVTDALGEIANMMGGSFKHHFVFKGHEVRLSIPSVIAGDEYIMSAGSLPDTMTLSFETGEGCFLISLYLENGDS